jgi:hypothetical protein
LCQTAHPLIPSQPHVELPELEPDDEPEPEPEPLPEPEPDDEPELLPEPDEEPELDPEEPDEEPDEEPEDDPDEPPEPDPDPLVIPELLPLLELDSTTYFVVPPEQAAAAIARYMGRPSSQVRTRMPSPPGATPYRRVGVHKRLTLSATPPGSTDQPCGFPRGNRDAEQAHSSALPFSPGW